MNRLRLALVSACLAFLGAAGPIESAPASAGSPAVRFARPGVGRVELVSGVLSPASAADPEAIARAYLATVPEPIHGIDPGTFALDGVRPLTGGRGAIVRLRQEHAGIPVVGGDAFVRIDADGRVRWMSSSAQPIRADLVTTPALDGDAAIAAVYAGPARHHGARRLPTTKHAALVIWSPPGLAPRLAWKVVLPGDLRLLETILSYVDAQSGRILYTENLVKEGAPDRMANVFPQNPVATPMTVQVQLDSLPFGSTQLDGPDILGRNCIDNQNCQPFDFGGMMFNVHMCDFQASAFADGFGSFVQYTRPPTDLEPEDPFAEVQIYYHSAKVYEYFRGFGLINLNTHPMQVVANFRLPPLDFSAICLGPTNDGPLNPLDNALFFPAGGLNGTFPPEDMLLFGQGTGADLSYEGDVVYHEMGHALAATVTSLGVVVPDVYGLDPTPGGMSEGYADYWSGTYTNDPSIGEYSGPTFGLGGPIRNMDNSATCPNSLWGQVHQDSLPWTGALWEMREMLQPTERAAFDQAVYDAFTTITEFDTMLTVRVKTVAEVTAALGAAPAAIASGVFDARGFDDCNNRVIDTEVVQTKDLLQLYGTDAIQVNMVPGPVQFRVVLDEDSRELRVNILGSQPSGFGIPGMGGAGPDVKLLVKAGDEPILWTWSSSSTSNDSEHSVDVTFSGSGNMPGEGVLTANLPAGAYHVMLANAGGGAFVQGITFSSTPGMIPPPDAGVGEPDADVTPDAGDPGAGGGGSDCGCRAAGTGAAPALGPILVALGAFLIVIAARRRNRGR